MGEKVFISGASGFIAQHIVKLLLETGYTVIGTVRTKEKGEKLKNLINFKEFNYVIIPDISVPGSFDDAFKKHNDIDYVIHSASPFTYTTSNPDKDLIEPALKGCKEILNSSYKNLKNLKRFIITSSDAAIYSNFDEKNNKLKFDENSWNLTPRELGSNDPVTAYYISKSLAELETVNFRKTQNPNFKFISINPSYVFGPQAYLCDPNQINESNQLISELLKKTQPKDNFDNEIGGFIDVIDVAKTHVFAIQNNDVINQRLFLNNGHFSTQMILDIINLNFPKLNLIKGKPGTGQEDIKQLAQVDNNKTKSLLPWTFTSLNQTVIDVVNQILDVQNKNDDNSKL
ncbi:GRP1 [Candida pseudojiufengensis]|uniref:GRP1 n=1 Tax=Candida pseudojiufengensis TaxID=497109 RepID=UPI0022252FA9|nr:GRP1 [Candida pseudojiufengensis]KAI5964577.1 GRP1 [Candida pseudojiufengensis]